jgi:signal transduction histidine kinase
MLLDGVVSPPTPAQQELLSIAKTAADKLLNLINDYLDFAKIDAGYLRLDLGEAELRGIVEASAHIAGPQVNAKRQTFALDLPPDPVPAHADAERLKQVLDNLISNAIKYTPEGGHITVQLCVEDEHPIGYKQAVFRVSDTGRGIPPEQLPALFTKYHRVPGETTRGIHGTGLGLLIVKEIVEAHGGTVSAESEGVPGKGSTFTVRIPLKREA